MNQVAVSVIVPIYNAKRYIRKCLDSLISQSIENMEIILVDDGSNDGSYEICEVYDHNYDTVVLHKIDHCGVTVARKIGIGLAKGEYIGFVDADDYVESDMYKSMYRVAVNNRADAVCTDIYSESGDNNRFIIKGSVRYGIYDGKKLKEEVLNKMLYPEIFYLYGIQPYMVNKLFRIGIVKEVAENIPEEICIGEDATFTYASLSSCERVVVTDMCFYHYVRRPGSLSYGKLNYEKAETSAKIQYKFLSKWFLGSVSYKKLVEQLNWYMTYMAIGFFPNVLDKITGLFLTEYGGVPESAKLAIYGAGNFGYHLYEYLSYKEKNIVGWYDKNATFMTNSGLVVEDPEKIEEVDFDYILISIIDESIFPTIKKSILYYGVAENKILFYNKTLALDTIMKEFCGV